MNRRDFFGWVGKVAAAIGLSQLAFDVEQADSATSLRSRIAGARSALTRMNGRACRDYRMISADQSIFLDKDIFDA